MPVTFASRIAWDLTESATNRALRERRHAGLPVHDLTVSNPTQAGFHYDEETILHPLAFVEVLSYDPNPRGMLKARQAVCRYYADCGAAIEPEQIVLTTSTSEAYSFLFRLLCNPGDEVLIAQPSYPLFDFLAQIDDVRLIPFPLFYDHGWQIDIEGLRQRITPRTRAIVLVHPNNPTGHFTSKIERQALEHVCAEHNLAMIVDEVFLDYPIASDQREPRSFTTGEHPTLTFVLSGLSKIAGLPQMKAAWICTCGPEREIQDALDRLEVIADTFLSMNAPIQHAMPYWLLGRKGIQAQILERIRENVNFLDQSLAKQALTSRLEAQAGWYVVLRIPAVESGETFAVRLIANSGVYIHPGHFFGFPSSGWCVLSLLTSKVSWQIGIAAIFREISILNGQI